VSSDRLPLGLLSMMAFRQLRARPGLTMIATLGVGLGVLAVIVTSALMWGAKLQFEAVILKVAPDITVRDEQVVDPRPLLERAAEGLVGVFVRHAAPASRAGRIKAPKEFMAGLEAWPEVQATSPVVSETALLHWGATTKPIDVRGIRVDAEERVKALSRQVVRGDWWAMTPGSRHAAIGSGLARQQHIDLGDAVVVLSATGHQERFDVVAVFESQVTAIDDNRIYIDFRTAQKLFGEGDEVRQISVRVRDSARATEIGKRIEREYGYRAVSWQTQNANFLSLLEAQRKIGIIILGAVLVLSAFGILAVQIMVVLQKRRDIAILRAVGFQRRDILFVFLLYGLVMATAGGAVGGALGKLAIVGIASLRVELEGVTRGNTIFVADILPIYAAGIGFAMIAGLLASVLPALSASRVEPVKVLRDQLA